MNPFSKKNQNALEQIKRVEEAYFTDEMLDEKGNPIDSAPHPMMTVKIPCDRPVLKGSLLRMKAE